MAERSSPRRGTLLLLAALLMTVGACGPRATTLPTPDTVIQAALTDLRPLTTSGLAFLGDWAPDGKALVYSAATTPFPFNQPIYGEPPPFEVWWMRADGSGARRLAEGHSPFFSGDGRTVYFQRDVPNSGLAELWAVDADGGEPRQLTEPIGGLTVHPLNDGRLVLSETGTYAPLRVLDPATGSLSDLSGPWPTNFPQEARLSPDGTRLAYPHEQEQILYLAEADGSQPRPISQNGGFGAQVWWSPDSRFLAYTTGNSPPERMMVADREGKAVATLVSRLEETGYVSHVAWSPDSRRLLVVTEAYYGTSLGPSRLILFDVAGNRQMVLAAYLHSAAWSPDGRTVALSRWDGPQGEFATHNLWLAQMTDRETLGRLPTPSPGPTPAPTPPLPLPGAELSPEEVIRRYWQAIDDGDYRTAYAALTAEARARQGLASWRYYWQCFRQARVTDIVPMSGDERQRMFQVTIDLEVAPECGDWMRPGSFAVLERETPDGPWLIEGFMTGP